MSLLYITDADAIVSIKDRQVIVEKKDGLKTILPLEKLEGIVLLGNAHMSKGCSIQMLERGIPVTYISGNGSFYGRLESTKHINIERQRCQFRCGDDELFRIEMGKKFVDGKINNQIVVLRRYNRNYGTDDMDEVINHMQIMRKKVYGATSIEQIMGYEGTASKRYFEGISDFINNDFKFKGRNRMPPRDPFNSLLSFGYTLLLYEMYNIIINKGLHPYAGIMHKDRQGHPALVSDLIEEWRPVIIDSMVLNLIQNFGFSRDDFMVRENGGVYLGKKQIRYFIAQFEKKIRSEIGYLEAIKSRMSFRRAMEYQIEILIKAIENRDSSLYRPVKIR